MISLMVVDKSTPSGGMYSSGHHIGYLELSDSINVIKLDSGLGIVDNIKKMQHDFDSEGIYLGTTNKGHYEN